MDRAGNADRSEEERGETHETEEGIHVADGLAQLALALLHRVGAQPFAELHRWLDEVEAFWAVELASFKAHAERTRGRKKR